MSHPPRLRILTVGKASVTCDAGTWIALPQEITTHEFSPNAHILSIHFLCQWPSGENLLTIRSPIIAKSRNHPGMERDASRLVRKQFPEYEQQDLAYGNQPSAYGNFLRLQGLFFNWLAAWFSLCTANGARVTRLSSGDHRPFLAARCLNQASLDRPFPA